MEADSKETREAESLASATREQIAALQATLDGQIAQRATCSKKLSAAASNWQRWTRKAVIAATKNWLTKLSNGKRQRRNLCHCGVLCRNTRRKPRTRVVSSNRCAREQSPSERRLVECVRAAEQLGARSCFDRS